MTASNSGKRALALALTGSRRPTAAELGHERGELGDLVRRQARQGLDRRRVHRLAQDLNPRPQRFAAIGFVAATDPGARAGLLRARRDLLAQARLAHARLARDQPRAQRAGERFGQRTAEPLHDLVAADERIAQSGVQIGVDIRGRCARVAFGRTARPRDASGAMKR